MKKTRRVLSLLLCAALIFALIPAVPAAAADGQFTQSRLTVAAEKSSALAPGVREDAYTVYDRNGDQVKMWVTTADPTLDTVKLFASYKNMDPTNYGMSKLTEQVASFNEKSNAGDAYYQGTVVAGINASYYNMINGKPTGAFVMNGVDVTTEAEGNQYGYFALMKDGSVKIGKPGEYSSDKGSIQEAIGIYKMLVVDGAICANLDDATKYPRQTIGITADGKVVLMTADGNQEPRSIGLTLREQAQVMLDLGCVAAGHLDGGGSCTYGARAEGTSGFDLVNSPSDGSERSISNGFLIVSTSVSDGVFAGAALTAEHSYVTPGSAVAVSAVGTDKAGAPAEIPDDVTWTLENSELGTVQDGVFRSNGTVGDARVQMVYNGAVVGETTIHVVIPDAIRFTSQTITIPYGKTAKLEIAATYGASDVATKEDDFVLTLSNPAIGTLEGLTFTAAEEGTEAYSSTLTAALAADPTLTATAQIVLDKGSEVVVDFEDGTDNGFGLTYKNYNYYLPRSEVRVVTAEDGQVHSGKYALALNIDYSNSLESGYQMISLYQKKQDYNGVGAKRLGMWMYIPDEYVGLWGRWMVPPIDSVSDTGEITYGSTITGGIFDGVSAATGIVYTFNESGWHYVSIDTSKYAGVAMLDGYYCFQFYISDRDGANFGYYFKNQHNVNGNFTVYIDDITFDYSTVVEDREAPVFGDMTYATPAMSDALVLKDGAIVNSGAIDFAAAVADNTQKDNYTGIDPTTAKAYVDGNEVPAAYANGKIALNSSASFTAGKHTVKLCIRDKQGNYASLIRTFTVEADKAQPIRVAAHDPGADRVLLGSVQYMDVIAANIEQIQSVTTTLDLDNMSDWQLDHMIPADGFTVTYSLQKDENIATLEITRTGENTQTGEAPLVSVPVRAWFLENSDKVNPSSNKEWTLAQFFAGKEFWPIAIDLQVDRGLVTYTDGTTDTFTGDGVLIWTEMWANYGNMTATQEGKDYLKSWNGGHTHSPEAVADLAPTCTEDGYTGRTFCKGCDSVVDWGTVVPAAGHSYALVDEVLSCSVCGQVLSGVWTDGRLYADGRVVTEQWIDESYYRDGMKLTGLQKIGDYYYDFGQEGVCPNRARMDGFFYDPAVQAYRYFSAGIMAVGEVSLYPEVYFFDADGVAVSGKVDVLGYTCYFTEQGAFDRSDDSSVVDAGYCGTNIQYVLLSNGTLKVDGQGVMKDYSSSGNYPAWVTQNDSKSITALEIGSGITKIGRFGFFRTPYLRTVTFAKDSSLETIGWGAFGHCWRLTGVTIPASVVTLDSYAFYECGAMTYVKFEENSKLTTINYGAFLHGMELKTVYIPETVTKMGADVFYNANANVVLQVADGSVGHTYAMDHDLKYELRPGKVTVVETGKLTDTVDWTLYSNGTLEIRGTGAMPNFTSQTQQPWAGRRDSIRKVVIGKDITTVGNYAFAYCQHNTAIEFEAGSKLTTLGVLAFFNNPKVETVTIPDSVTFISAYALGDCFALTSVYVPQGVTGIYKTAFANSSKAVLNVAAGTYAETFAKDHGLRYTTRDFVYIPVASGSCGENATWEMYENGELWIKGSGAMANYTGHTQQPWANIRHTIKKIVIGKDITTVGNYAFAYCQNTTAIEFKAGSKLTTLGVLAFFNNPKVESVAIPDTVTYISAYALGDCFALTSVYVPQGVTGIYKTAFTNSSKAFLNVAEGTYAETYARDHGIPYTTRAFLEEPIAGGTCGEDAVWELYENGELRVKGTGPMENYTTHTQQPWASLRHTIKKIVIGKDITTVGNYAFAYCQNTTAIEFEEGSKLTALGILAFFNNPKVETVVLPETVTYISAYALGDCFALTSVYVPQSVTGIYKTAFTNSAKAVLNVAAGSYAETFAKDHGISYTTR